MTTLRLCMTWRNEYKKRNDRWGARGGGSPGQQAAATQGSRKPVAGMRQASKLKRHCSWSFPSRARRETSFCLIHPLMNAAAISHVRPVHLADHRPVADHGHVKSSTVTLTGGRGVTKLYQFVCTTLLHNSIIHGCCISLGSYFEIFVFGEFLS